MKILNYYRCFCPTCGHKWSTTLSEKCPKCKETCIYKDEDAVDIEGGCDETD